MDDDGGGPQLSMAIGYSFGCRWISLALAATSSTTLAVAQSAAVYLCLRVARTEPANVRGPNKPW